MTEPAIVGLAGSYSNPSKTRILVEEAARRTAHRYGLDHEVIDLAQFGPELGSARRLTELAPASLRLVAKIVRAEALIVASPVYKGSYTGLFKHLIDLFDPASLAGKPVLLAATGGGDKHALVIEHQLRPLFGFFEARTLATGVYASERDFADGALVSETLSGRLDRAIDEFGAYFDPYSERHSHAVLPAAPLNGATPRVHVVRSAEAASQVNGR